MITSCGDLDLRLYSAASLLRKEKEIFMSKSMLHYVAKVCTRRKTVMVWGAIWDGANVLGRHQCFDPLATPGGHSCKSRQLHRETRSEMEIQSLKGLK